MPSVSKWKTLLLLWALMGAGCRSETERLFAEAARAEGADDYEGAARRLREAEGLSADAPENDELQARLDSAESGPLSMDETSDSLAKLQERIHWGSGRVPRRER